MKGNSDGLILGTIQIFAWKDRGNPQKPQSGYLVSGQNPTIHLLNTTKKCQVAYLCDT
jgi:hypothetical protein